MCFTLASKSTHTVTTRGENINIRWSPNGNTIAVGNKEDLLTFVDTKTFKIINEEQFKYEVSLFKHYKNSVILYHTHASPHTHIHTCTHAGMHAHALVNNYGVAYDYQDTSIINCLLVRYINTPYIYIQ